MVNYPRRINKFYQKAHFDIQDGLSTYDLQLLSLTKKRKQQKRVYKDKHEDQLVA